MAKIIFLFSLLFLISACAVSRNTEQVPDKLLGLWDQEGEGLCIVRQGAGLTAYEYYSMDFPVCPVTASTEHLWGQKTQLKLLRSEGETFYMAGKVIPGRIDLPECKHKDCYPTERTFKFSFSSGKKHDNLIVIEKVGGETFSESYEKNRPIKQ